MTTLLYLSLLLLAFGGVCSLARLVMEGLQIMAGLNLEKHYD